MNPNKTFLDYKKVNDWLNDETIEEGYTILNSKYKKAYLNLIYEFSKRSVLLYFLTVELGVKNLRQLFNSVNKQKTLLRMINARLHVKKVEPKWIDTFDYEIRNTINRLKTIDRAIDINLNLTEFYPYFKEFGYDFINLNEEEEMSTEELRAHCNDLLAGWEAWKADNQDKIDAHMEATRKEREALEAERARNKALDKAEKEAAKAKKLAANAEVKEIKKNSKRTLHDYNLDKSFSHLYKEAEQQLYSY